MLAHQHYANSALNFDQAVVVAELREVMADPAKMDQRGYPLCGPDPYLRMVAVHHPDVYVAFVVALLTTDTGTLGGADRPSVESRSKRVRNKGLWSNKMRIGEWVATASLRIGSNTAGYDTIHQAHHDTNKIPLYKHWHAQIGGMTGLKEMRAWLRAADPNLPVTLKSYWATKTPRSVVADINGAFAAGQAVALAIDADIVDNGYGKKISPHLGGHLVTLASDIQVTADGANYIDEVLTWGDKKPIVFRSQVDPGTL